MKILGKLFGSEARVKILRLFLFNPQEVYENADVASRAKVYSSTARREVAMLRRIGLIKRKYFYREAVQKGKSRFVAKGKRVAGWTLNEKFQYLLALQGFLLGTAPIRQSDIVKRLERVGRLKFVAIAGAFLQDFDSRIDLLVVGDGIKRGALEDAIKSIEAELGRELRFAVFNTRDFQYRLNIYDKLIRDVLDYPHQKVLDRLDMSKVQRFRDFSTPIEKNIPNS